MVMTKQADGRAGDALRGCPGGRPPGKDAIFVRLLYTMSVRMGGLRGGVDGIPEASGSRLSRPENRQGVNKRC
eukprot:6105086-Alexandrium_andersonii.AAC.1